jgi:hypothetical protein
MAMNTSCCLVTATMGLLTKKKFLHLVGMLMLNGVVYNNGECEAFAALLNRLKWGPIEQYTEEEEISIRTILFRYLVQYEEDAWHLEGRYVQTSFLAHGAKGW